MICFGFGLFVQVAAHAAAVPQFDMAEMDCSEMANTMPEHMSAEREPADRGEPCQDMALDCLVAMNCLPPFALGDTGAPQAPPAPVSMTYLPAIADRLESRPLLPESPPPQTNLTV